MNGVEVARKGDYVVFSLMMLKGVEKKTFEKQYVVDADAIKEASRNGGRWSAEATTCSKCSKTFLPHECGWLKFRNKSYPFCGDCSAEMTRGRIPVEAFDNDGGRA